MDKAFGITLVLDEERAIDIKKPLNTQLIRSGPHQQFGSREILVRISLQGAAVERSLIAEEYCTLRVPVRTVKAV